MQIESLKKKVPLAGMSTVSHLFQSCTRTYQNKPIEIQVYRESERLPPAISGARPSIHPPTYSATSSEVRVTAYGSWSKPPENQSLSSALTY